MANLNHSSAPIDLEMRPPARGSYFGLFDCDAFYASAEALREPKLAGIPLGILDAFGRNVVARSYEMKPCGVNAGMLLSEASRLCPTGIFLKADFAWYGAVSAEVLEALESIYPRVEYYSIDEFYFEIPADDGADKLQKAAEQVRDTIFEMTGVRGSIGVARTRTLAKMASEIRKPFGAVVLPDREAEWNLLRTSKITDIPFIADKRAEALAAVGIFTPIDFVGAPPQVVRQALTVTGERLWWELNGEPVEGVATEGKIPQSISRGGTFGAPSKQWFTAYGWLARRVERVVEELEFIDRYASRLTLQVRGLVDGKPAVRSHTVDIAVPTRRFEELLSLCEPFLHHMYSSAPPLSHLWVSVSNLKVSTYPPGGLFAEDTTRSDIIARLKREAREQFGRYKLRSGATLGIKDIYLDPAHGHSLADTNSNPRTRRKTVF